MDANNFLMEGTIRKINHKIITDKDEREKVFLVLTMENHRGKNRSSGKSIINKFIVKGIVSHPQFTSLRVNKKLRIMGKMNYESEFINGATVEKWFVYMDSFEWINTTEYNQKTGQKEEPIYEEGNTW